MNTAHAAASAHRRLSPIGLWTPPHRRWLDALTPWIERLHDALDRAAQRRVRQRAAREIAALAALDARTLRDIGLDEGARTSAGIETEIYRRELDLRGF
jgi:uncharacterized protein YjiS (DUF1127 family)